MSLPKAKEIAQAKKRRAKLLAEWKLRSASGWTKTRFAEKHGLLITAGSDFHGNAVKPDVELGGDAANHYELLIKLKEHRDRKR